MSLDESLFASPTVHEREVELSDGNKHKLYFRELPGYEFIKFREQQNSDDLEIRAKAVPRLIAAGLCTPDGKPAMTAEKALMLKSGPMTAIMVALLEVNSADAKKPLPSAEKNGSDAS